MQCAVLFGVRRAARQVDPGTAPLSRPPLAKSEQTAGVSGGFLFSKKVFMSDGYSKLENRFRAIERELDELWGRFGMRPPQRVDSGGTKVVTSRNTSTGRLVIDRGARPNATTSDFHAHLY